MTTNIKWNLSDSEKEDLISILTPELTILRTKADISQGELANIIGVSRQTYGAIERGNRRMTWNTYLSLIMFYDYNSKTHDIIHSLGIFPKEMITRFNDGKFENELTLNDFLENDAGGMIDSLDEQARHAIKTMIMVEYARCTGTSGEAVVKAFDGISFRQIPKSNSDIASAKAIKAIRRKYNNE